MDEIPASQLDASLETLTRESQDELAGLYGENSMTWRVSREAMLFSGSWRAALLQLAHPWVAQAVREHSTTQTDPVGRFHRTFRVVFSMMFGDLEKVRDVSHTLHQLHRRIRGRLPSGAAYSANGHRAMTWVLATLWDTSLRMHDVWVRPLSEEEKNQYLVEGRRFARCFGLDPDALPSHWPGLQEWMAGWIESGEVAVSPAAVELGRFLFAAPQIPGGRLIFPLARRFTGLHLPEPLRTAFGLPLPGRWEGALWSALARSARTTRGLVPRRLRWLPVYFEALERLSGALHPSRRTRFMNRLWIGQPELVSASPRAGRT